MSAYSVEVNCTSGLALTIEAFARVGGTTSNVVSESVAAIEKSVDKGRYVANFATLTAGEYRLSGLVGGVAGFVNEIVSFGAADNRYPVQSENTMELGVANTYKNTVTLTDAVVTVNKP